jgi:hypothetical protein
MSFSASFDDAVAFLIYRTTTPKHKKQQKRGINEKTLFIPQAPNRISR